MNIHFFFIKQPDSSSDDPFKIIQRIYYEKKNTDPYTQTLSELKTEEFKEY